MDVDIRAARADEAEEVLQTFCAAFGLSCTAARPIFYGDPFFNLSHKRILRTPKQGIVSCLTIVPGHIRIGSSWVRIGGITGVATLPQHQGHGYAARLLTETLPVMADEFGYLLAGLFAPSDCLYRRLGWAVASHAPRGWRLPLDWSWPAPVRLLNPHAPDELQAIRRLHGAWAQERTGGFAREERRWRQILGTAGHAAVVYPNAGEDILGYAIFDRDRDALLVSEAVGACAELLPPLNADSGLPLMVRVVDVPAALRGLFAGNLRPVLAAQDSCLTIHVQDEQRLGNNLSVRLDAGGVTPGSDKGRPWISLEVSTLAQVLMGFCLPSEAACRGDVAADSAQSLAFADALFPLQAPRIAPLENF